MKEEKGLRYNDGKPKWSLVHFKSLEPLVRVLEFGALKYAPYNWQKGLDKVEILESLQRHLVDLIDAETSKNMGEKYDKDSNLHHIGHIMCNAMFYSYFENLDFENNKNGWNMKKKEIN